jgi:hypothetical protein
MEKEERQGGKQHRNYDVRLPGDTGDLRAVAGGEAVLSAVAVEALGEERIFFCGVEELEVDRKLDEE